ncbi:APO domain-containing protein [Artemisia annua]|uniref:APO domain-containing protein n=1 Tax=Artemisia annua TaxID=35608 RepID=A0A2U1KFS7_ARTAN|nr:APO domain-containing protein [Artemisia annua]
MHSSRVDLPDFPTKRRRKPIIRISKSEFIDADESELPDLPPEEPKPVLLAEIPDWEIIPPSNEQEIVSLAEETLEPTGHKAQNCEAFKHHQRNGQHG